MRDSPEQTFARWQAKEPVTEAELARALRDAVHAQTLLTTEELAVRWRIDIRSLENWRNSGHRPHPPYTKPTGTRGRVLYRLADVLQWEIDHQEKGV